MGQGSPLASSSVQVQNGIDHFAHLGASGASSWLGGRNQWLEDPPLVLADIAGVASSHHLPTSSLPFFLFSSSSILSPGRRLCRAALQACASALSSFIWLLKPFHTASQRFPT